MSPTWQTSTFLRHIRLPSHKHESSFTADSALSADSSDLEHSINDLDTGEERLHGEPTLSDPLISPSNHCGNSSDDLYPSTSYRRSRWTYRERIASFVSFICARRRKASRRLSEKHFTSPQRRSIVRKSLRLLALALMLFGLLELLLVIFSLLTAFFPEEFDRGVDVWRGGRPSDPTSHWPTDATADIIPIACHSHNDYWRKVPLHSALKYGCTGVEADVWLHGDQLYVGHSTSSLTPARTLRSLYVDPLMELLERQNPNTTFHPTLDTPRNGVFDTKPEQTLVLLIDFKTDGHELWRVVSEQLEPLRRNKYLSHFNGSSVIEGPVTVVVTGNAPFDKVVENRTYRDMFFDAPLDRMAALGRQGSEHEISNRERESDAGTTRSAQLYSRDIDELNQGQGHSGSAPENPAVYSAANSYYASVSFAKSVGHALPYLTSSQRAKIRQQIAGAHSRGLKVRYWGTPNWPRGLRNYLWRILVREGVDYLNVDDLRGATRGDWKSGRKGWGWLGKSIWASGNSEQ